MKKIFFLILISLSVISYSQESYVEKPISFGSAKVLGMGNTFVAQASGLEAFEFNPAGISEETSINILSGNFNMITNYFQLGDDLIEIFNEDDSNTEKADVFFDTELSYFLDPDNREKVIGALLNQVSTPYEEQLYANGLGFASSIATGFTAGGVGVGLLVNLDSEVFGEKLHTAETNNVLTTALLLGYSLEIDLGIIGVSAGVSARPMYKVRSTTNLEPVAKIFNVNDDGDNEMDLEFLGDLTYYTGVGVGVDAGVKAHAFGLTVGIALMDIMGTEIFYTENSYDDIVSGNYLGSNEVEDEYITPPSLKLGLAFNPKMGGVNKVFNPTIALDYNLLFVDDATIQEYAYQGSFWKNLSLGAEVELFSFMAVRGGLNQGYVTLGLGLDLFVVEIDAAVYSKELGEDVGERQQMGAVIEFAIRI